MLIDPMTEDLAALESRAEEEVREQRWDAFVTVIKARRDYRRHWSAVAEDLLNALSLAEEEAPNQWAQAPFEQACSDFAESEGWDCVFSAIARAMREQAKS